MIRVGCGVIFADAEQHQKAAADLADDLALDHDRCASDALHHGSHENSF